MPIDLNDLLHAEQAGSFRRQGDAAATATQTISQGGATFLNILDRVMLREYSEPSFAEAAAMKEARGGGDAQYAMGMRTARIVPGPDGGA